MANPAIADEPTGRMTREEYHAWVEQQPRGRFERIHGIVVARDASTMAPERASHNQRKFRIAQLLDAAVQVDKLPCNVFTDGMTVSVDDSDYEPDAILRCGPALQGDSIAVPDPLIIVEVLSPSSRATDRALKFGEYFKLPSLRHYLIVWPDKPQVVHHYRNDTGGIDSVTVVTGDIRLDPPGITIHLADIYDR